MKSTFVIAFAACAFASATHADPPNQLTHQAAADRVVPTPLLLVVGPQTPDMVDLWRPARKRLAQPMSPKTESETSPLGQAPSVAGYPYNADRLERAIANSRTKAKSLTVQRSAKSQALFRDARLDSGMIYR